MILVIDNKHCTSVAQLKEYFSMDITPESDIYADLLDYGRYGDIAEWLREMGEPGLASKIDSIATDLSDSVFYVRLKAAITGLDVTDSDSFRPPFDKCFSFEGITCDVKDNEAKVTVNLKVLMCVNEKYKLSVSSNWGMCVDWINPYNHPEGRTACFDFTLHKQLSKDFGEIMVKADEKLLADEKVLSKSVDINVDILVDDVKFKMIHVEGGTFTMGATHEQEKPAPDEQPAHQVTLSSFSIGETLVTQELWQAVMGSNPSYFKGAQRPVEHVSWNDCLEFLKKLRQKTGKEFRLPAEAEWEFAARGGLKSKGYQYSGSNDINEVAWYDGNSYSETHPVKTKKPNELGIYDMSGNVGEWCQDKYDCYNEGVHTTLYFITGRVNRGSSWFDNAWCCRVAYRHQNSTNVHTSVLGFRLAL